jgi:hypothetical protein
MLPMLEPPPGRTFRPYGPASDAAVVTTPFAITSPWTPYGLSDDPFFQEPLDPTDDTSRPVSLFVGRRAELQLVAGQIVGNKHASRALVQGAPGVGKTSFVSALKYGLARQQDAPVLMHRLPVRIQAGMNPRQFTAAVLQVLLQMRGTLVAQAPAPARAGRAAKRAVGAGDEAFWTRVARVVAGEDSLAGGVSTPLFGAQQERVRIAPEVQDLPLDADVAEAVARLAAPEDGGPQGRRGAPARQQPRAAHARGRGGRGGAPGGRARPVLHRARALALRRRRRASTRRCSSARRRWAASSRSPRHSSRWRPA